ncbi:MAG TPA: ABC-F family ATP-binding cassette domain-containing protein, partial [Anaerolineaceae bacterium]
FTLNPGERLGLVGPNGCGKSTLLRILAGVEHPDSGSFQLDPPSLRVGTLAQDFPFTPGETIGDYLNRQEGDPAGIAAQLERTAADLARDPDQPALQAEYDLLLTRLSLAAEGTGRGREVLAGLGLGEVPLDTPAAALSGGQKTRLALAGILAGSPRLLLLDEPTNHLDLDMLAWLEEYLVDLTDRSHAGILFVSHDRAFLDRAATGILDLDPQTHRLHAYPGNYSAYLAQKLAEREAQAQAYSDQQEEIARLDKAARRMRSQAQYHRGGKTDPNRADKFAAGYFANRGKETIQKAKNIERRLGRLMGEERVEKPRQGWQMKLEFAETPASGRDVMVLEDLDAGYGGQAVVNGVTGVVRWKARVAVTGPNGSGKTTLLRTIAGSLPPVRGAVRLGANVRLGMMAQEQEELDPRLNALETILTLRPASETDVRAFLAYYLFTGDSVFTPAGRLSFGERARLSLARMVALGCNLLLLDEPLNHLDIPSRVRFEQALAAFEGAVLAVVHDRYFIEGFASEIWEVRDGGV